MIDESIMEKIIPLPDEDEEMEKVQGELEGEGFPITNFKKGGIFYLPDACDHIHRAERACPYYREWMLHQTC